MKKLYKNLAFALLACLAFNEIKAQTVVTIPAANTAGGGANNSLHRKPFGTNRSYERSAMKYTNAEIGILGNITAIGFYCDTINNPGKVPVKIYLKEVPDSTFTASTVAAEETGATLVYQDTIYPASFTKNAWTTVTLTTAFAHLTTNNIEVIIETNSQGTNGTDLTSLSKGFRYSTVPSVRMEYWQSATNSSVIPAGNGVLPAPNNRTNVQFTIIPAAACTAPPTPGTTVATPTVVCGVGGTTNLSLNGNTSGIGQTYQWLSSPNGTTWSPIGGANGTVYTATVNAVTYYKCKLTCTGLSDSSTSIMIGIAPNPTITATYTPNDTVCANSPVILNGVGGVSYVWTNGVTNGVAFNPAVSATYTVTGTDVNGCKGTATQRIVVNPAPNVNYTTGGAILGICPGITATLTASGAVTYTWTNTGSNSTTITVTPTVTTSYTLVGTDAIGCTGTRVRTIPVFPVPTVTTDAPIGICLGQTTTVTATSTGTVVVGTWQWSGNAGGGTSPTTVITPTVTDTYTLLATDAGGGGCTDTVQFTIGVGNPPSLTVTGISAQRDPSFPHQTDPSF